ncbi:MAG TPA: valine--tRNA ligase [Candidatus Dormibacteraeota bacterium]|nr:valine--tRNA ligase [Candidatus Dormibacteraeota bacterium]
MPSESSSPNPLVPRSTVGEMPKAWRPQDVEERMYSEWEEAGLFRADPADPRPHFSIAMPPPNVTGELHLGHAEYTLQDLYCRYKRMQGHEVLWIPGTDHAAIATQNVIEKQLAVEGTSKEQLGRAAFDRRVEQWYADYGGYIVKQLKRLGFSADWSRLRFTMDDSYVHAVREAFVRLYNDGLIYRGPRIVNWCPRDRSSISDLEVDWREHEDTLYYIRYEMADGDGALVIATVRPETMLADTGVAVNPGDPRYRDFIGRTVRLPLVGRELPVVADESVAIDFGTGALKVTPGHDPMDYEIGQRHGLEILSAIDKEGNIVSESWVPDELRTRDALTARDRVVEMLRDRDHLVRTEAYLHEVGHCDRCGEIIQPLVDDQWWCAMSELARPAIEVVERGEVTFVPEKWNRTYLDWMRGLRDWNVSRQLWLGHRLPIYYCLGDAPAPSDGAELRAAATHVFASAAEPAQCPECGSQKISQDPDVLDTWFSSGLWPFATLGWPGQTPELDSFYPTDVLDTAREIINLWVARMIMTSLRFTGKVPFHHVLIHAVIQDPQGQRMSKSKGNGVDPLEMVERYGADAVRAWACDVGLPRQDVRFDERMIDEYSKFANKLWNVARLALMNAEGVEIEQNPPPGDDPFDRWVLSRLDGLVEMVTEAVEGYHPSEAVRGIYDFTWKELADWYLEAAKPRFRLMPDDPERRQAVSVAVHCVDVLVRLLHPFMPFVTQAIWDLLPGGGQPLIARAAEPSWPAARGERALALELDMAAFFELVRRLRDARKEMGVAERESIAATRRKTGVADGFLFSAGAVDALRLLARVEIVQDLPAGTGRVLVADGVEITLGAPAAGAGHDKASLERDLEAAKANIDRLEHRLGNADFVNRANPEVVQRTRDQLEAALEKRAALEEAFSRA